MLISETTTDSSFTNAQFQIGYTNYELDRNADSGGIFLYIREDIPSTLLNSHISTESFYIEINIRKNKWLLVCTSNPNKNLILNHLKEIAKNSTIIPQNMTALCPLVMSEPTKSAVRDFCDIYYCKNLIKDNTFFNLNLLKTFFH